jgi:hypothetical protein
VLNKHSKKQKQKTCKIKYQHQRQLKRCFYFSNICGSKYGPSSPSKEQRPHLYSPQQQQQQQQQRQQLQQQNSNRKNYSQNNNSLKKKKKHLKPTTRGSKVHSYTP